MGAETFENVVYEVRHGCKTAKEAFDFAVEEAYYDYGHAGYTGTICEKQSFVLIKEAKCNTVKEALTLANKLIDEGDDRIDDKWGPAGCIEVNEKITADSDKTTKAFVFFGWA